MVKSNLFKPGRKPLLVLAFNLLYTLAFGQVPIPYFNDFDTSSTGWTATFVDPGSQWELGSPTYAPTNSTHSGSSCWDINLTTPYVGQANATLESPVFMMDTGPYQLLSFWQNMDAESFWDGMRLDYSIAGGPWLTLGNVGDPNAINWYQDTELNSSLLPAWCGSSNGWIQSRYKIYGLANQTVQFRFVFTSDPTVEWSGVSMDDFSLYPAPGIDLAVTDVYVNPALNVGTLSDSVAVTVSNSGSSDLTQFTVSYTYNNLTQAMLFTDTLAAGDSIGVKLPGFTVVPSSTLCGNVSISNDADTTNNRMCEAVYGYIIYPLDFYDNFDSASLGWMVNTTGDPQTIWESGTPAFGYTTGSYSGNTCWDINLFTGYNNLAQTQLISPQFDLSGSVQPIVDFWINHNTEPSWDGVRIEYMQNNSGTWQVLGVPNDPNAINWYNAAQLMSSQLPGWCSYSSGWKYCRYNLPASLSTGIIQFRFVFDSDVSVVSDGFSMDNFSIHSRYQVDAAVAEIVEPTVNTHFANQPLVIKLRNDGIQTLTSIPVSYSVNNQTPVNLQWNGTLMTDSSVNFIADTIQINPGLNEIEVYSSLTQDAYRGNDTLRKEIRKIYSYPVPYATNFDSTGGWNSASLLWQFGLPNYGATNSAYSPANCWDIMLNGPYPGNSYAELHSPAFDVRGNNKLEVSFKLNYNTQVNSDGLMLFYSTDSLTWYNLGTMNDSAGVNWYNSLIQAGGLTDSWSGNSQGWIQCSYKTTAFANESLLFFKFIFVSDGSVQLDGVSIDDFQLKPPFASDASAYHITSPSGTFNANTPQVVTLEILNEGSNTISSLDVHYSIDNVPYSTLTWNGNLPLNTSTLFSFPAQLIPPGPHILKAYITWPQDMNPLNDTTQLNILALQPIQIPYSINFDNGQQDYHVETTGLNTTAWEYGIPMYGTTNTSHSAPNAWDVNLFNPYNNLARTYLVTPPFDFSNLNAVSVNFWVNYNTEVNADGMYVQYTTDDNIWIMLGGLNDPLGSNWYNSTLFNGIPGWTGNSQGWTQVNLNSFQLSGLPYCRLRFAFQSDFNLNGDGVSLDDLSLSIYTGLNQQTEKSFLLYPNPANETIYLEQLTAGKNTIVIMDALGRVVFKEIKSGNARIDCSEFATGTYVVKVETEKGEISYKKLVKK